MPALADYMNKLILIFILILPISLFGGEPNVEWPDLSSLKSISGRSAIAKDVKEGAAVFIIEQKGVPAGFPIDIEIPQYGIHRNAATGEKTKVVIIQAEEAEGQKIVGAIIISTNKTMAGLFQEFELLGTRKPNN